MIACMSYVYIYIYIYCIHLAWPDNNGHLSHTVDTRLNSPHHDHYRRLIIHHSCVCVCLVVPSDGWPLTHDLCWLIAHTPILHVVSIRWLAGLYIYWGNRLHSVLRPSKCQAQATFTCRLCVHEDTWCGGQIASQVTISHLICTYL